MSRNFGVIFLTHHTVDLLLPCCRGLLLSIRPLSGLGDQGWHILEKGREFSTTCSVRCRGPDNWDFGGRGLRGGLRAWGLPSGPALIDSIYLFLGEAADAVLSIAGLPVLTKIVGIIPCSVGSSKFSVRSSLKTPSREFVESEYIPYEDRLQILLAVLENEKRKK